ncbi:MAG TPA: Asp/Glu racemase [Candidatus Angelobacter sp.]|nr:Asp/Glu racemase [Candidatus Angelobacter sp.]
MSISPLRVGLIVPSSNTVMEPDFHRQIGKSAIVSTTRILLEDVTREAETRMLEDSLPQAIKLIGTTASDVIVFGCTSAGALGKLSHDDAIARLIEERTGAKAVTVLRAVLMLLSSIRPQKTAVLTPYIDDLTASIARSLAEAGFPPIKAAGMGIKANLEIGRVTPAEILQFVESQLYGIDPDCLFLSCTNWRAIETIEHLQKKLGMPIVTSNQAAIEIVGQQGKVLLAKGERL